MWVWLKGETVYDFYFLKCNKKCDLFNALDTQTHFINCGFLFESHKELSFINTLSECGY